MDLTSAVNVMMWAADRGPEQPGYALWHIFPASASAALRKFLREEAGFEGKGDPIHSQTICLTPLLLEKLYASQGIRAFTIKQYPGDAVYIPAGCAHQVSTTSPCSDAGLNIVQVSNATDAIKIALDFVDFDSLARTRDLVAEFRQHRLATRSGDDVLQFYNLLWHAWCSLSEQAAKVHRRAYACYRDQTDPGDPAQDTGRVGRPAFFVPIVTSSQPSDGQSIDDLLGVPAESTRKSRQREKRRDKNRLEILGLRLPAPRDANCSCPLCSRSFGRSGLIDHL